MDGIRQQLRLVAGQFKTDIGMLFLQIGDQRCYTFLQIRHPGVALFDDSQRDSRIGPTPYQPVPFCRTLHDFAQLFESVNPSVMVDIDIFNIFLRDNPGIEMDAIPVLTVLDTQSSQGDIIIGNRIFEQPDPYPHGSQFRIIGNTKQFRGNDTADIDHSRLRQLFDPFRNDIPGKLSQLTEIDTCLPGFTGFPGSPAFQGQVEIESRDIGHTGLNDFRTFHILRQGRDSPVQLLVHFDKNEIDITVRFEIHINRPRIRPGFSRYIFQPCHLRQLIFQRFQQGIIHLTHR